MAPDPFSPLGGDEFDEQEQQAPQQSPEPSPQPPGMQTPAPPGGPQDVPDMELPSFAPWARSNPYRYAVSKQQDAIGGLFQQTPWFSPGEFGTEAARQAVMSERIALQEAWLNRNDTLTYLTEQGILDMDGMTEAQLEDVVAVVNSPGLSLTDAITAAQQLEQEATNQAWVDRYNSGGLMMGDETFEGSLWDWAKNIPGEFIDGLNRGNRRREMWLELSPDEREAMVQDYGVQPPALFGTDMGTGVGALSDESAAWGINALNTAWFPVKSVIGFFEWEWRAGQRLYRGQLALDQERGERIPEPGERNQSRLGRAFGGVMDTMFGDDRYADAYGEQFAAISTVAKETGQFLRSLTPFAGDGWSRRWEAGSPSPEHQGEDRYSPPVVDEVAYTWQLDDPGADIAMGIGTYMDSSVFGSPLARLEQGETTMGRLMDQLTAYGSEDYQEGSDSEVEQREQEMIENAWINAVDSYVLETVPGTSEEAANKRSGVRALILSSPQLKGASMELAMRGKLSFGRQTAARLGHVPGTESFNRISGLADGFNNFMLDPAVIGSKVRTVTRLGRAVSTSRHVATAQRVQDIYDGVQYLPGIDKSVPVPRMGAGFRRSVDTVAKGLTEGINSRLNAHQLRGYGISESIEDAGGALEEATGVNRGYERVASQQPRFEPYYKELEDYVFGRLEEAAKAGDGPASPSAYSKLDEAGQRVLTEDVDPQLIVDWMKTNEGLNSIVNGHLGGVMSKIPTVPSESLPGTVLRAIPRGLRRGTDFIDGITSYAATRLAERGAFDNYGKEVVGDVFRRMAVDIGDDTEKAEDLRRVQNVQRRLDTLDDDVADLPADLRDEMRSLLERKSDEIREARDAGEDVPQSAWLELEVVAAKLDKGNALRQIGLNATGLRGHSNVGQIIHAAYRANFDSLDRTKRLMMGLGGIAWAPIQFTNGLARSFTILAPSSTLRFGDRTANATIRNYAALLDPQTRARLSNAFATAATDGDQINIARNIVLEVADTLGLPYTDLGRKFMSEQMRMLDSANFHRYSSNAKNNFIGGANKRAAAIRETDLADQMALPSFTKLQHIAQRMRASDFYLNPFGLPSAVMNHAYVDTFMGKVWQPGVLFRLGFGVRTSADEMMAAFAREGAVGALQSRIARSAIEGKGLIPEKLRLDRSILRTPMRLIGWTPAGKWSPRGMSMEQRLGRALDLDDETLEILRRTRQLGAPVEGKPGVTRGTKDAQRIFQEAIGQANPYEVISLGVVNKALEHLNWLKTTFAEMDVDSLEKAARAMARMDNLSREQRKGALSWGPTKLNEVVRLVQSKFVPDEVYRSTRLMLVLQHDVSRHIRTPQELSAAMTRVKFQSQHADVLGNRKMSPSGRAPHPNKRYMDVMIDGYQVMLREGRITPEWLDGMMAQLERDLGSKAMRTAIDSLVDDTTDIGGRLERGEINYGQWRDEMHQQVLQRLQADEGLLDTFRNRFDRARELPDGRVVLGTTQEQHEAMAQLVHSASADLQWRERAAAALARGENLEPSDAARFFADSARTELEDWMEAEGWTVNRIDGTGERQSFGTTFYDRKTIEIYDQQTEEFWTRLEDAVDARNRAIEENGGRLPDDWDDTAYGTDYLNEMGINPFEVYEWYRLNGGLDALKEKVYWHEVAHAYLHSTAGDMPRLAREVQAEEFAFAMMGMPFGSRSSVFEMMQSKMIPEGVTDTIEQSINQRLGGIPDAIGVERPSEMASGLGKVATSLREALDESMGMIVNEAWLSNERMRLVSEALADSGITNDNVFALLGQMIDDGVYVAYRHTDRIDTFADEVIESLNQLILEHGKDAFDGGFPMSQEMMEAVADYAEYLQSGLVRAGDEFEDVQQVLRALDDEGTSRLFAQMSEDGIDGVDADIVERLQKHVDVDSPEWRRRGGPASPMRAPSEGETPPVPFDAPGQKMPRVNLPKTERDLLRLSRELTAGRYASPDEALEQWVDVLVDELEENWFSSPESVANDLAAGSYQPAEGAKVWLVLRDPEDRIVDLREASKIDMREATPKTELLEASVNKDEALSALREGRAGSFLKPLSEREIQTARNAVESTLRHMHTDAAKAAQRDPELRQWTVSGLHTFDDFIQYATVTARRNNGKPDEFVAKVIDQIRRDPSTEGTQVGQVLDRLLLGYGRDTYQRRRPMTSIDKIREMRDRFDGGADPLTMDELASIGDRMPARVYAPRYKETRRQLWSEFVTNAYELLTPVIDYLTRHPLMGAYYHEGLQAMKPVLLANRPRMSRVIDSIWTSDDWFSANGALRSKFARNGYVSVKELGHDLPKLTRVAEEGADILRRPDNPLLDDLLQRARVDRAVLDEPSGRWFWNEFMPKLVDEMPPLYRMDDTEYVTLYRGMDQEMDLSRVTDEGTRFTDDLDYALVNTNADENTVLYAIRVPKDRVDVGTSEFAEIMGDAAGPRGALLSADELSTMRQVPIEDAKAGKLPDDLPSGEAVYEELDTYLDRVTDVILETEIQINDAAMTRAMTQLQNYTDNEAVATLFSSKHRNLFPFFWAEERFIKRVFQTAWHNPQGVARAGHVYRGLGQSTIPMRDENDNAIFAYPGHRMTEDMFAKFVGAFGPELRTPNPLSAIVGRWDRLIPGGLEASPPSNPNFLVGILGRTIMSHFPEAEGVVRPIIGDIAANTDREPWETVIPSNAIRALRAMDEEELLTLYTNEMVTTFMYMESQGLLPDANADTEEWDEFYLELHGMTQVWALQNLFYGLTGVTAPQLEVAPGHPQHDFRETMVNYGWDAGRDIWMQENPDETLFTLFSTETAGGAPIPATRQVDEFLNRHEDLMENFSEAGGYLIPTAEYSDEFYRSAWATQARLGLRRSRWEGSGKDYIENVHDDLEFQRHAPEYFEVSDGWDERIEAARDVGNDDLVRQLSQGKSDWQNQFFHTRGRFERLLSRIDEQKEKRDKTMEQMGELDRALQQGDERVEALVEENPRADLTLRLYRDFNVYVRNMEPSDAWSGFTEIRTLNRVNRQAFVEYWQTQVNEHPNELGHFWERIILPQLQSFNQEDADAMLLGTGD